MKTTSRDIFLELVTKCQYDTQGMFITERQKSAIVWAEAALRGAERAKQNQRTGTPKGGVYLEPRGSHASDPFDTKGRA